MTKIRLKYSSEKINEVIELRRSFIGLNEISLKTNLNYREVREILLSELSEEEYRKTKLSKKLSSRDSKIIDLTKEGQTLEEIGRRFDISRERVRQVLKKHGVEGKHALKVRKKRKQTNIDKNIDKVLLLIQQGMTEKEIIKKSEVEESLYKEIKARLIEDRRIPRGSVKRNTTNIDMEIRHENILALRKDGLKNPAIAKYLGVSTQTIHRDVRKMKLKGIDIPGSRLHWNEPFLAREREELYVTILKKREQGFTLTEIAEHLDMPYRKIQDRYDEMRIMGIKTL
jgi:transposase